MFIIHVTPVARSPLDRLTYFSSQEIPVGSIVKVPLRSKEVPALVLEREDARTIKAILRTSLYETKKIEPQKPVFIFSPEFVGAAEKTAAYFATSVGSLINSFVPAAILAAAQEEGKLAPPSSEVNEEKGFEKLVLQLPREERFEKYKTIVRSRLAQGESVLLCAPTVREVQYFKEYFRRGIESYTHVLESSQSKKKQVEAWNAALSESHPVLIIATPTFVSIPRSDVSMYIIEREMSSSYKQQSRPRADARILIENFARKRKASCVYGGTTVSLKTHKDLRDGLAVELEEYTRKLRSGAVVHIVDSKKARTAAKDSKKEFPVLSAETLTSLIQHKESGVSTFVFAARRGLATHTVCNDCATSVVCNRCKSPMVLHERQNSRDLLCHRCGSSRDAHETCTHCGSWNLVPLGIGVERVEQYIKKHVPNAKVIAIHSDATPTAKQAQIAADDFYANPGSILIGTEMALSYVTENVAYGVMSSIDSLLCVPDFRIEEKLFNIITTLRERIIGTLTIETTSVENSMLKHAKNGSIAEYITEELTLRSKLHYPPYTHIIQVSCSGSRDAIIEDMQKFVKLVQKYKPRVFGGFIPAQRGSQLHALIRVEASEWPVEELTNVLRSLPQSFEITIDPERSL